MNLGLLSGAFDRLCAHRGRRLGTTGLRRRTREPEAWAAFAFERNPSIYVLLNTGTTGVPYRRVHATTACFSKTWPMRARVPQWEVEAQAVADSLVATFHRGQALALATTETGTDAAQLQLTTDSWNEAVGAHNRWVTRYPDPMAVKSKFLPRFLVYSGGLGRMAEALKLSLITLKLLPQALTDEQRKTLYKAMEVSVTVFTANQSYVFSAGPATTSGQIVAVNRSESVLNETFNSRLLPMSVAVAQIGGD
ncbi:MAG TPA: hypothetical protein VN648_11500 [Candidatus Methylomirabilis sp.]|nr:hypothetical protein [Candidatus Methylomirabilis sp.]